MAFKDMCVIVVKLELFELYYWHELYALYYKKHKVHKVRNAKNANNCVYSYKCGFKICYRLQTFVN